MQLTREEMETIICFNEGGASATVGTYNKRLINSIKKNVDNGTSLIRSEDDGYHVFEVPKSWVKVKPPAKRNLTDEQRAAAAERMRLFHKQTLEDKTL